MWRRRAVRHRFPLGQVVITRAAAELLVDHQADFTDYLERHVAGDWGDVPEYDAAANENAMTNGDRIQSVYPIGNNEGRLWIITEADRSVTTLLTPDDY